ncbi:MAG: hypothetical protein MUP45_01995 [Candidatus Marinimicrobia bacterium]|nr:hypothetical protein [Candidatus Neomarinimicrobiota bacterium]
MTRVGKILWKLIVPVSEITLLAAVVTLIGMAANPSKMEGTEPLKAFLLVFFLIAIAMIIINILLYGLLRFDIWKEERQRQR